MNTNVLNHNEGMTKADAAVLALILTALLFFTTFLPLHGIDVLRADVEKFIFDTIAFLGTAFFTEFVALAGLNHLTKPRKD